MTSGLPSAAPADPRIAPRRLSPFRIGCFRAIELFSTALGGRRIYRRMHLGPKRFRIRRETVRVPRLPRSFSGYRIAHLSDLHAGPFLGAGDLANVVEAVNDVQPDACVITGDFITRRWHESLALLDDLAALRSRDGTFAVFGNHDYHRREEGRIAGAFAGRGIRFLRNDSHRVERDGGALVLVGLEDLEEAKIVDLDAARSDLRPGDVEVMLCHNPFGAKELARPGCAVILSGHTHGNQVDLPFFRRLGAGHPGDRTAWGATELIVSRGLGVVGAPVRIGSPAEVVLVELCAEESDAG